MTRNAILTIIGCAAVVVVALSLSLRVGWSPHQAGIVPVESEYPEEFRAASASFERYPDPQQMIEVLRDTIAPKYEDLGLSDGESEALIATLVPHMRLIIAPDLDAWLNLAGERAPPAADPSHPDHEEFLQVWEKASTVLADSPIGIDQITARFAEPGTGPRVGVPETIFLRSGEARWQRKYGDPPEEPGIRIVETLVPMQYRTRQGEVLPVTVTFRFYKREGETSWHPADLYLYFDRQAFGKRLSSFFY